MGTVPLIPSQDAFLQLASIEGLKTTNQYTNICIISSLYSPHSQVDKLNIFKMQNMH